MPPYFSTLRESSWVPEFTWLKTVAESADQINKPHKDYPSKVSLTQEHILGLGNYFTSIVGKRALQGLSQPPEITSRYLQALHGELFSDMGEKAACWRTEDIEISNSHHPPKPETIEQYMVQLEMLYEDKEITIDMLIDWYTDFETIHPFHDGNGRVGGTLVAVYSHFLYPERGWFTALQ